MTGLIVWVGFFVPQTAFYLLFPAYSLLFVLYVWVAMGEQGARHTDLFVGLAIFLRLVLWFAFPNLSDDVYRFIWDGRLLLAGYNPFDYLPRQLMEEPPEGFVPDQALFQALNSKDYFTVYPPMAQAVFALATWVFPDSWYGSAWLMKLPLVFCDIGNVLLIRYLLIKSNKPASLVLWYALNPLILLEISGNLHFEGLMLFFFLLAWILLLRRKNGLAMLVYAFSVAAKLLTLLYVPLMLRRWEKGRRLFYPFLLTLLLALLFLPFFNATFGANLFQSLDLYFRRFEFNASFYYLFRELGFWWSGYNKIALIGPSLSGLFVFLLAIQVWREREPEWQNWMTAVSVTHSLYLLGSTTIHPWYLSFLIAGVPFTGFRYAVVWSYLSYLSYHTYSHPDFSEHPGFLWLEYGITLPLMGYEWYRHFKSRAGSVISR